MKDEENPHRTIAVAQSCSVANLIPGRQLLLEESGTRFRMQRQFGAYQHIHVYYVWVCVYCCTSVWVCDAVEFSDYPAVCANLHIFFFALHMDGTIADCSLILCTEFEGARLCDTDTTRIPKSQIVVEQETEIIRKGFLIFNLEVFVSHELPSFTINSNNRNPFRISTKSTIFALFACESSAYDSCGCGEKLAMTPYARLQWDASGSEWSSTTGNTSSERKFCLWLGNKLN